MARTNVARFASVRGAGVERRRARTQQPVPEPAARGPVPWLRSLPGPAIAAVAGSLYLALSQYVIWLNDPVRNGAGFWPAAGLTVALLLLLPSSRWLWVLGAVAIAEFTGDIMLGYHVGASLLWMLANTIEPLIGASLVRYWGERHGRLLPLRNLGTFVLFAVLVGPLVGATIGSVGTVAFIELPAFKVWPKFLVGDALGVLVVAPILLTLAEPVTQRSHVERVALWGGLLLATFLVFRDFSGTLGEIPHLVLPFLIWAALRFGIREAAWSVFLVAQSANISTAFGAGPFTIPGAANEHAITLLQIFLIISGATAFVVAALAGDLADRSEVEAQLAFQARHDWLTGLPNRRAVREQIEVALAQATEQPELIGILFCDLDGLKRINDSRGHAWGDAILVEAAMRLRRGVRPSDFVARFGGDEFLVLCKQVDGDADTTAIAHRMLEELTRPFTYQGESVTLSGSVGVVIAHDPAIGVSGLISAADAAMYRAKQRGGGSIEVVELGDSVASGRLR